MSVISGRSSEPDSVPDKEAVSFSDHVPAGDSTELTLTLPADATVERLAVRIYTGAELDLQLRAEVQQGENAPARPLVQHVGKDYIDGDDDFHEWDLSQSVEEGDAIVITAENNDGSNAYDFRANMDIDYASGGLRLFGGVL